MVRLKVSNIELQEPIFVAFQFLMVRLKVDLSFTNNFSTRLFQFLMVRLKEGCPAAETEPRK